MPTAMCSYVSVDQDVITSAHCYNFAIILYSVSCCDIINKVFTEMAEKLPTLKSLEQLEWICYILSYNVYRISSKNLAWK